MKNLIFALLIAFTSQAQANDFDPSHWEPGLHLFAGGGFNSSVYMAGGEKFDGGLGSNLKTDLVYFLNSDWALEASSAVKFNRVDGYLIWDTLLTVGVRTTLPNLLPIEMGQPYGRLFVGRAPTVLFLDGDSDLPRSAAFVKERSSSESSGEASRIQFDGPVAGIAVGSLRKTNNGTVWFTELAFTVQSLDQENDIKMDGDVPVVISQEAVGSRTVIYGLAFSVGIMAF